MISFHSAASSQSPSPTSERTDDFTRKKNKKLLECFLLGKGAAFQMEIIQTKMKSVVVVNILVHITHVAVDSFILVAPPHRLSRANSPEQTGSIEL